MKKMVSLVVALAMLLLLLCACGQTEEPQNSPEVQNTGEPVADESEGFTIGFANVFVGNTCARSMWPTRKLWPSSSRPRAGSRS